MSSCPENETEEGLKKRARRRLLGAALMSFLAVCMIPFLFKPPASQNVSQLSLVVTHPYGTECTSLQHSTILSSTRRDWKSVGLSEKMVVKKDGALSENVKIPHAKTLAPVEHQFLMINTTDADHSKKQDKRMIKTVDKHMTKALEK